MIAWLKGVIRAREEGDVVVDVHGVGYAVSLPTRDAEALPLGEEAELLIHTVVREDALQLFGFRTLAARELFLALTSVPGVGPKGAMAMLAELDPTTVARAIHDGDVKALTRAKGVGKRTAELIVVKLRERMPPSLLQQAIGTEPAARAASPSAPDPIRADVESALSHLGYRPADAAAAVDAALDAKGDDSKDFDRLLRSALALLRRDAGAGGKR